MTFAPNEKPTLKLGKSLDDTTALAIHPDGSVFAAACGERLHVVALPSMKPVAKLDHAVDHLQYSTDGALLVASSGKRLTFHDPRTGAVVRKGPEMHSPLWHLTFSPDGKRIAVGGYQHVHVFDVETSRRS